MSHEKTFGAPDAKRRAFLAAAGSAALAAPLLGTAGFARALTPKKLTPLSFAWNQTSFCLTPVAVAKEAGIFEKNGLDVNLVNYSGSTDQLLEAIATGKSDAAVGMIFRWLKPLEAGFDVKVVAGLHGGCMRLSAYKPTGITKIEQLRGKVIGIPDLGAPSTHFFKVYLHKNGIDPEKDIAWRVYQRDLLGVAAEKGEIQAIADTDPLLFKIERDSKGGFTELASNISGEYHNRSCCVIGVSGKLVRENRPLVAALARSLVQAYDWTSSHIDESARIFLKYTTNITFEELQALYGTLNLHHHPVGTDLRDEIIAFAQDFKGLGVLKPTTDPVKYANRIFERVL